MTPLCLASDNCKGILYFDKHTHTDTLQTHTSDNKVCARMRGVCLSIAPHGQYWNSGEHEYSNSVVGADVITDENKRLETLVRKSGVMVFGQLVGKNFLPSKGGGKNEKSLDVSHDG